MLSKKKTSTVAELRGRLRFELNVDTVERIAVHRYEIK